VLNLCLACREIGPDGHGGLPRATCDLAQALAAQGHSVRLLTDAAGAPGDFVGGVPVEVLPVPPPSGPWTGAEPESAPHNLMHAAAVYREVRRIHEHEQPVDAVLAPLWRSEGAVCLLDDRFPTIVTCMTSLRTLSEIDGAYGRLPDIGERLRLEGVALARSRYLHGLTEAALRKTIDDYGLNPRSSAVIGRGLRDRGGPPVTDGARDGRARVLFVGRLERRKGVDTLLAAARELVEEGVAVDFTLAGLSADPSIRASFEREAASRPGLSAAVHFAGPVSDAELDRLYAECDIVCVPSRYESHGVVLIEAMMFAKPIVTCEAGGVGEVVTPNGEALVVAPDDPRALAGSLRRLLASAELRAQLGAGARETFERRFEAAAVAAQMTSFLGRVSAGHERAASDVAGGLETLLTEALDLGEVDAGALAGELLDPPASAWRAWARAREREAAASSTTSMSVENARLRQAVAAQEATLAFLHERHETLRRVEEGGWWRLRGRLLPLLRLATRVRARVRRHDT